jgi:hypothetical protein
MHTGLNQGAVAVAPELLRHATTCPACSKEFKGWIEKANIGRILTSARKIIQRAGDGDPTVRRREGNGRRFYFGSTTSGTSIGTLVTTDEDNHILQADEGSLEDFFRLQ